MVFVTPSIEERRVGQVERQVEREDVASADEPYVVYYAGRDVSDEVRTSPVEVGAVAFEDAHGAVRIYVCNDRERPRDVVLQFRDETYRRLGLSTSPTHAAPTLEPSMLAAEAGIAGGRMH